jgi:hypothetical protein
MGTYPGMVEAVARGWFSKENSDPNGPYWIRTTADDPNGGPDLNRLAAFKQFGFDKGD